MTRDVVCEVNLLTNLFGAGGKKYTLSDLPVCSAGRGLANKHLNNKFLMLMKSVHS